MPAAIVASFQPSLAGLRQLARVVEFYQLLRRWVQREASQGLYEVLEYEATLELLDPRGQRARFTKRQRVKFLQDNVIAFEDFAWGDGQVLTAYRCAPGVVVDRYREGDHWNVLISLRETRHAGDVADLYMARTIRRGFTRPEEWWQIAMQHRTRHLKLRIIFPHARRCQRAVVNERTRDQIAVLDAGHFSELPDGRQVLSWETARPRRFETYTFSWRW